MLREGREYAAIAPNVVVKCPLTTDGLRATRQLTSQGIKVNVTLCFSAAQAILAAKAGAAYISPFIGRLDDIGQNGLELVREIVDQFLADCLGHQHFYLADLARCRGAAS